MGLQADLANTRALKYATTFDEKLLGAGCDVDVVVDIETGDAVATVAMRPFLRSSPVFQISLDNLRSIHAAVVSAKTNANLLEKMADGAGDHQLQYEHAGAALTVIKLPKKEAKAVLTIGSFTQESELSKLSVDEIEKAISTCERLMSKAQAKVSVAKR